MDIEVFTLFPQMFECFINAGILKRAIDQNMISIKTHNIRDYTHDKHHVVDDTPYGGGSGMVLKPEPIFEAVESVKTEIAAAGDNSTVPVILLTPQGRMLSQEIAGELAQHKRMCLICGRYEGVDERVREHLATDEISIGDYVLSGGELPAMVVIEAVTRLIPGVLGSEESAADDSFVSGLLEYPHYTRPVSFRDWQVPGVLLSGNHAEIAKWRKEQAISRTKKRRPDLIAKLGT